MSEEMPVVDINPDERDELNRALVKIADLGDSPILGATVVVRRKDALGFGHITGVQQERRRKDERRVP